MISSTGHLLCSVAVTLSHHGVIAHQGQDHPQHQVGYVTAKCPCKSSYVSKTN